MAENKNGLTCLIEVEEHTDIVLQPADNSLKNDQPDSAHLVTVKEEPPDNLDLVSMNEVDFNKAKEGSDSSSDISYSLEHDVVSTGSNAVGEADDYYFSDDSEDECAVFLCSECAKRFTTRTGLKAHMAKKHNPKALVSCSLCDSKYRGVFAYHVEEEHKEPDGRFYCKRCNYKCEKIDDMLAHKHNREALLRACPECRRKFVTREKYEQHLAQHRSVDGKMEAVSEEGSSTDNEDGFTPDDRRMEKNFTCETCGKRFTFGCLLRDHVNLHTGVRPYLCPRCGRCFAQKTSLKQHARTHNPVRQHKCERCDRAFHGNGDLKKHMRSHTGERPYVCEICEEGFHQSSHLVSHRRSHDGDRPHRCQECGRGFSKRGDLVRHSRIHTGDLPYGCDLCGKSFRQLTQRANHIKIHHSQQSPGPPLASPV